MPAQFQIGRPGLSNLHGYRPRHPVRGARWPHGTLAPAASGHDPSAWKALRKLIIRKLPPVRARVKRPSICRILLACERVAPRAVLGFSAHFLAFGERSSRASKELASAPCRRIHPQTSITSAGGANHRSATEARRYTTLGVKSSRSWCFWVRRELLRASDGPRRPRRPSLHATRAATKTIKGGCGFSRKLG
jgi:hypothetical protein